VARAVQFAKEIKAEGITGAVLLYLSPRHGDRVTVVPGAGGDGASVWLDLSP